MGKTFDWAGQTRRLMETTDPKFVYLCFDTEHFTFTGEDAVAACKDEGGVVVSHYDELSDTVKLCSMYDTLLVAVKLAEDYKIRMNLEGLNIKVDHVGNFLQTTQQAAEITRLINSPWLKILFDAYHMQYNEGALCYNIEKYFDQIGHIHIADCRHRRN